MKRFFAAFFGTLAALAVLLGSVVLGLAVLVGALTAKQEKAAEVTKGAYLVLDLADEIQDTPFQNEDLEQFVDILSDNNSHILQSRAVIRALEAAATDPDIGGLYLSGQGAATVRNTGFAALKEIRDAIAAFHASGKPVKAWLNLAGTREYYLASAADEVSLDPFGAILMPGLASQPMFYAGTFEKFGIGVQVTRVGKYKSAVEPYTRKDMSPESRAQTQKLLGDIWSELEHTIEASRKLEAGTLQHEADVEGLMRADAAKQARLVDRVAYIDEVLDDLRTATNVKGKQDPFKQISMRDYARLIPGANLMPKRPADDAAPAQSHEKLAIVYAEGTIVDGSGSQPGMVWGDKVARDLRAVRLDETVKAVVLRVNSPGGSVTASEAIGREVRLIQKQKPVVVSMGSLAASGGYWISTYSDRIFAEPTTITGSIGVFGLLFNVQGLATDKLGVTFETVKTARFADAATVTRPKTPEELAVIQSSVDWIYSQFLTKVAESRKMDVNAVGEIAQGRVWSGTEALKIGLVDEIGGLDAAIAFAARKAAIGDEFEVVEYPRKKAFLETVTEALNGKRHDKTGVADPAGALAANPGKTLIANPAGALVANPVGALVANPVGALMEDLVDGVRTLAQYNDPRGLYARLPFDPRWQ